MTAVLRNNASSPLTLPVSATDTVITVDSGALFPTLTSPQYFYATLVSPTGALEIVKVTSVSGNNLFVTRAQESTGARNFPVGSLVEMRITAASILDNVAEYIPFGGSTNDFLVKQSGVDFDTTWRSATTLGLGDTLAAANETVTGVWTFSNGFDVGNADTTLNRVSAGDISVEGNLIYRVGGTDVAVADGGTGASNARDAWANLGTPNVYWPELFGAAGDGDGEGGGTNDATALQSALTAIDNAGGGTLFLVSRYRCDSTLTVGSNTRIIALRPDAGIDGHNRGSSGAMFSASGTVSGAVAITATANKGEKTLTVAPGDDAAFASTSNHAVGALVRVFSSDIWYNDGTGNTGGTDVYAGELNFVRSTSSGSIELLIPLRDTYSTSPQIELVNAKSGIVIEGGTYIGGNVASTNNADEFTNFIYCRGVTVRDVILQRIDAAGFQFAGCQNVSIVGCRVEDMRSGVGYGVSISNSQDVFVDRCWFIRCRHATSCASALGAAHRGPCRNINITNFIALASAPAYSGDTETSSGDCIDFHGNTDGALVSDGWVIGSSGAGVLVEGVNVTLNNLKLMDCGRAGVIAQNFARRDGYFKAYNVDVLGWALENDNWQAVDIIFGADTLAGTFDEIIWQGGTIVQTNANAGQNGFRARQVAGTNTAGKIVFKPDFMQMNGQSNIAIQVTHADSLSMRLSGSANSAGSDAVAISNCGNVRIEFDDFEASGAGGDGISFSGCTAVSLEGKCDFSSATTHGVDLNDTDAAVTSPTFDCSVSGCGGDGLKIAGTGSETFEFSGLLFGTSVTGVIARIGGVRVNWNANVVGSTSDIVARIDNCDGSVLSSGCVRRTATQSTAFQISDSDDLVVSSGFKCDMSAVTGGSAASYVTYVQRSDRVRFSGSVLGANQARLLTFDECDSARVVGGADLHSVSSSTGIQIDADCNDVYVSDDTIIEGCTTAVADSGTGTVYNKIQPYAEWAATDIASVTSSVNTSNKYAGRVILDTTNNRKMQASGSAAADAWYTLDASTTVTPS